MRPKKNLLPPNRKNIEPPPAIALQGRRKAAVEIEGHCSPISSNFFHLRKERRR